ncbi:MAG: hypothetical protein WCA19_20855 [Candidatus Acidiferrales bacterium]
MSTPTSTIRGNELSANESSFLGRVQPSGTVSHPQVTAAESYDMSPRTRKIVYLTLLAGVLFLGSVAAYVWYGFYQWQNIR